MTLHRGKIARAPSISLIRPLTREDLELLREERLTQHPSHMVKRLRDPHHRVARLTAVGLRTDEVAARSGYSYNRVVTLQSDPAFQELVAKYREKVDKAYVENVDDFIEIATGNMMKSERMIAERLEEHEEEGTFPPIRDLIAISRDAADRFGYGKRQTNVNVNVDYAAQLEKTIARSKGITLEASSAPCPRPQAPMEGGVVPAFPNPPSVHPTLPLIRRRA